MRNPTKIIELGTTTNYVTTVVISPDGIEIQQATRGEVLRISSVVLSKEQIEHLMQEVENDDEDS